MNVREIREIAGKKGVSPGRMTKAELVKAIQAAEGNDACFDSGRSGQCGQEGCLWKKDCR